MHTIITRGFPFFTVMTLSQLIWLQLKFLSAINDKESRNLLRKLVEYDPHLQKSHSNGSNKSTLVKIDSNTIFNLKDFRPF